MWSRPQGHFPRCEPVTVRFTFRWPRIGELENEVDDDETFALNDEFEALDGI